MNRLQTKMQQAMIDLQIPWLDSWWRELLSQVREISELKYSPAITLNIRWLALSWQGRSYYGILLGLSKAIASGTTLSLFQSLASRGCLPDWSTRAVLAVFTIVLLYPSEQYSQFENNVRRGFWTDVIMTRKRLRVIILCLIQKPFYIV